MSTQPDEPTRGPDDEDVAAQPASDDTLVDQAESEDAATTVLPTAAAAPAPTEAQTEEPTEAPTEAYPADGTAAMSAPAEPEPVARRRGPRVGTVVWGLVLAVLGVGVLAWAADRHIDIEFAAILLIAGAGVALLLGSVLTVGRRGQG